MRLIDADALRERMYHDAFEMDSDMQKWDGGCWIRYKMFENAIDDAPTVEPQQWIPVSSGNLPKVEIEPYYEDEHEVLRESKQVLMWAKNPNNGKYGYALGTLINIDGDEKRYELNGVFNDVDGIDPYHPEHVIAWMSLPSPFREGGAEECH